MSVSIINNELSAIKEVFMSEIEGPNKNETGIRDNNIKLYFFNISDIFSVTF